MSEVKYRGKVDGVWWHVSPDHNPNLFGQFWHVVDRETVGQYIGDKDKSGKEIYEGDIIKHSNGTETSLIEDIHAFCGECGIYGDNPRDVEIIGNRYEQPELLQKAGEA